MSASSTAAAALNYAPLNIAAAGPGNAGATRAAPMVESVDLLKGCKAVGILHNGSLYRLQATKLGKLILTK